MQKVNEWFLKNEGISFDEFCEIYNNGNKNLKTITFLDIPYEIKKLVCQDKITIKDLPKRLIDFLEEENALKKYIDSTNEAIERGDHSSYEDIISIINSPGIISDSIWWSKSEQGNDFWENLHNKYKRL